MRVLVTGSAGFLGRHFCQHLAPGHEVTHIDLYDDEPRDALEFFRTRTSDRFDLVLHLAANGPWRLAIDNAPLLTGTANLELDAAMFGWAAAAQPGRVVYFSSSAAYPIELQKRRDTALPLREDAIDLAGPRVARPHDVYGWTKLTGELLARHYANLGGKVTVVRPFSGYGSDQAARFPFGAFRDRAVARLDPFEIWGDAHQVRDFVHVDDVVGAVMALVAAEADGPVNVCTGVGTSMAQLGLLFAQEVGYRPAFRVNTEAPLGVAYRVGDSVAMRAYYQPKVSIELGVQRAIREAAETNGLG